MQTQGDPRLDAMCNSLRSCLASMLDHGHTEVTTGWSWTRTDGKVLASGTVRVHRCKDDSFSIRITSHWR